MKKKLTAVSALQLAIAEHIALFGAVTHLVLAETTFRAIIAELDPNAAEAIVEGAIKDGGKLFNYRTTVLRRAQFTSKIIGGHAKDPPELEYVSETRRQIHDGPDFNEVLRQWQRGRYTRWHQSSRS